jgi:hypothetical protein
MCPAPALKQAKPIHKNMNIRPGGAQMLHSIFMLFIVPCCLHRTLLRQALLPIRKVQLSAAMKDGPAYP